MTILNKLLQLEDRIVTDLSILQQVSRKTSFEECDNINLFNRLRKAAVGGWTSALGLVSIQIGIDLSAFYYEFDKKIIEVVNPVILEKSKPFIAIAEGCLSFPNQRIDTQRYKSIIISGDFRIIENNQTQIYLDQKFSLDNLEAHIFLHEYDHTIGETILDHRAIIVPIKREFRKIGRNEICPLCSSGKKFKHCCIDIHEAQQNTRILESKE